MVFSVRPWLNGGMSYHECTLLDGRVKIRQPEKGFRVGFDTVFAAAAVQASPGDKVLDMGCGVGGIAFSLLARQPDCHVTGVEIENAYYQCALINQQSNKAEQNSIFFHMNMADFKGRGFDVVVTNPPYMDANSFKTSPEPIKNAALGGADLTLWMDWAYKALKPGGQLVMIHRADCLQKIILAMGDRFGALEIIPLQPKAAESSGRVILRARKGRKSPSILHPPLIIHKSDGSYTKAAESHLREASSLSVL